MHQLLDKIPQTGRVEWIGVRPQRESAMTIVVSVKATASDGLEGDRAGSGASKKRQVTLIQHEHLVAVGSLLGTEPINPDLTRRNIVVSGINLLSLKDKPFQIGEAVFLGTGLCAPCSKMETNLGEGGYQAMRGHGGITARVVDDGTIAVGDTVSAVSNS